MHLAGETSFPEVERLLDEKVHFRAGIARTPQRKHGELAFGLL
jgi:hypothetical protein